jgi:[1-hydroxy-2-(trimethylamino)ethyl]phosphonate dioxygenase
VDAKRYLCATDSCYRAGLSPASLQSLELQGGVMNSEEEAEFEADAFYRDAVRLRRWDDLAKIQDAQVPPLSHYRTVLESALKPSVRGTAAS